MSFLRKAKRAAHNRPAVSAEEAVFRALERQWAADLKGHRIPSAIRKKMLRDPQFQAMVQQQMIGSLCLDEAPERIVRRADGTRSDALVLLLGDDPALYRCTCGDEKAPNADLCTECRDAAARFQQ